MNIDEPGVAVGLVGHASAGANGAETFVFEDGIGIERINDFHRCGSG